MTKLGLYLSGDVWFFNQPLFHAFASWVLPYVSITTPMLRILRVIIRQRERLFYIVCNAWFHFSRKCDVLFLKELENPVGAPVLAQSPWGLPFLSLWLVSACFLSALPLNLWPRCSHALLPFSHCWKQRHHYYMGVEFPTSPSFFSIYIKKLYAKKEPESTLVSLYKMWEHNHRSLRFRLRANEENLPAGKC